MKNEEALKIVCMITEGLNPYKEKEISKNLPETNPITESAPRQKAESPYGTTKMMCEDIIEDATKCAFRLGTKILIAHHQDLTKSRDCSRPLVQEGDDVR